jgi:N-acetyl-beta-hexosaminidase
MVRTCPAMLSIYRLIPPPVLSSPLPLYSWSNDTDILAFMNTMGYTSYNQLLEYFVLKVDDLTRARGSTPIHWEEVFKAGARVDSDVIFQVWTSQDQIAQVVKSKFRTIASPSDVWYLE